MHNEIAILAIQKYHTGQVDSLGCPYWLHPYRVALTALKIASQYNENQITLDQAFVDAEVVFQTAMLHDVPEDTKVTDEEMLGDGFAREAIKNAHGLDKANFKSVTYDNKIAELVVTDNVITMIVKLADNLDNSQLWRAKVYGQPTTKYLKSMVVLADALNVEIKDEWR